MELLQSFQQHWNETFPQPAANSGRLLLAVSGGADSVVLVDLLYRAGIPFSIAHANFGLRGEESVRDEQFVRQLGEKYGVEVIARQFDTAAFAEDNGMAVQEAARELRYEWFREIVEEWDELSPGRRHWIATAHHADDNIETVLMHFLRGTGIHGLAGIQPVQTSLRILRPLLPFRKNELLAYAERNGLSFVEDSSNASDKYTRNFLRNTVLPQLRTIYPQVDQNILNNIGRLSDVETVYRRFIDAQLQQLTEHRNGEVHIPVLKWKKADPIRPVTWEIIRPYGFHAAQADEVIRLLDASNGAYISSDTYRIIRNRNWMIIAPLAGEEAEHVLVEAGETQVGYPAGILRFEPLASPPQEIPAHANEAYLDAKQLQYPLLLRKWKQGDYFYPLGMQKKKKLSRFFIDNKLSRTQKENIWVLESHHRIVWVIGYRIDNRFRIKENQGEVLRITC